MVCIGIFSITLSKLGLPEDSIPSDVGISKAYVDWAKSMGDVEIRLIPHNVTMYRLKQHLDAIHGLILPGGGDDIHHPSSPYYQRIEYALQYATQHKLPVFGICAGLMAMLSFELGTWPLHVTVYNMINTQGSQKILPHMAFTPTVRKTLEHKGALIYNHHYGVDQKVLRNHDKMSVMAVAPQGYVSMVRWKQVPWIATQFHPEKPQWEPSSYQNIPRSQESYDIGNILKSIFYSWMQEYALQNKGKAKTKTNAITWPVWKTPKKFQKLFDMPASIYIASSST